MIRIGTACRACIGRYGSKWYELFLVTATLTTLSSLVSVYGLPRIILFSEYWKLNSACKWIIVQKTCINEIKIVAFDWAALSSSLSLSIMHGAGLLFFQKLLATTTVLNDTIKVEFSCIEETMAWFWFWFLDYKSAGSVFWRFLVSADLF